MHTNNSGFTLIELTTALLIMSILTIIAVSLYSSQVLRGRRIDAINTLLAISLAEDRYRTNNTQYGTLAQVWNGTTATSEGYYTLSITSISATGYTISAQAQGNQANDTQNGTACSTLQLIVSSGNVSKTPTACWPT